MVDGASIPVVLHFINMVPWRNNRSMNGLCSFAPVTEECQLPGDKTRRAKVRKVVASGSSDADRRIDDDPGFMRENRCDVSRASTRASCWNGVSKKLLDGADVEALRGIAGAIESERAREKIVSTGRPDRLAIVAALGGAGHVKGRHADRVVHGVDRGRPGGP